MPARRRLTFVKERRGIPAHWGRMKAAMRSLLLVLNVLALCLYGAAAAGALGGMGGEAVVICGANGPETVRIATGGSPADAPADAPHECCKCLSCIAISPNDLARSAGVPIPVPGAVRVTSAWGAGLALPCPLRRPLTRGPPSWPAGDVVVSPRVRGEASGAPAVAAPDPVRAGLRASGQDIRAMNEVAR